MDEDVLVNFILDCAPGVLTVDILGSWDNFRKAHPLRKDKQIGHGRWYACPRFSNIICDGDPRRSTEPRDGALRAGGTYWFYFRINDDIECPSLAFSTTSTCPLLPGQLVNVLEVPKPMSDGGATTLDLTSRSRPFGGPPKKARNFSTAGRSQSLGSHDQIRHEYLRQYLGRLQTAAADSHILNQFGHPLRTLASDHDAPRPSSESPRHRRPVAPVVQLPIIRTRRNSRNVEVVSQADTVSGLCTHLEGGHTHISRSFSNPFRKPKETEQHLSTRTRQIPRRPADTSDINGCRPASEPSRPHLLSHLDPGHRPQSEPIPINSTDQDSIVDGRQLLDRQECSTRLRVACAKLNASLASRLPAQTSIAALKHQLSTYSIGRSPASMPGRFHALTSNGSSTSPSPGTRDSSLWGSPFFSSFADGMSSPPTSCDERGSGRGQSQLYSVCNSRDGLSSMLDALTISSQETIKPGHASHPPMRLAESVDTEVDLPSSGTAVTRTDVHDKTSKMIDEDLCYLGSAIS